MARFPTDRLQAVVEALNGPPFNQRFTLISLTELLRTPMEAVQLLASVCAYIRPVSLSDAGSQTGRLGSLGGQKEPKVDTENFDRVLLDIAEYTICLVHSSESTSLTGVSKQQFAKALAAPDSYDLKNLLYVILRDVPAAKETCYLQKYRAPPYIPPEFAQNQQVQQLLTQLREAQSHFTAAHTDYTTLTRQKLQQKGERLATDRSTLISRRDQLFERVKQVRSQECNEDAVRLANRRRIAMKEVAELREQIRSQNDLRKSAIDRAKAVMSGARGSPADVLEATEKENQRLQREIEVLPEETAEKESLAQLILSEPNEDVIRTMELELEDGRKELSRLREITGAAQGPGVQPVGEGIEDDFAATTAQQAASSGGAGGTSLAFIRQQLKKVERSRDAMRKRVERARQEGEALDKEMANKLARQDTAGLLQDIDNVDSLPTLVFKDLITKGKAKKALHMHATEEQLILRRERAVLMRTVSILEDLVSRTRGYGGDATGDDGAGQEHIIDTQNLGEARAILGDIENALRAKKEQLAPRIHELNQQRRKCSQLEAELDSERQRIKNADVSKEGVAYRLKVMVNKAESEVEDLRTEIKRLEAQAAINRLEIDRAGNEREAQTLRRNLTSTATSIKNELVPLKERQGEAKQNAPRMIAQKRLFADLEELLQAKLRVLQKRKEERESEQNLGRDYMRVA